MVNWWVNLLIGGSSHDGQIRWLRTMLIVFVPIQDRVVPPKVQSQKYALRNLNLFFVGNLFNELLVGGFKYVFMFTPKLGEDGAIFTHIFQLGWFNSSTTN